ncbi:hypothetical protein DL769_011762 [Monosporascus sp. CRB-8-3]|nr:hypothetical protein DL769_011762 [Monosporascus sp. CRB-8-3]
MSNYENEAHSGEVRDNSYVSDSCRNNEAIPVQSDRGPVEDPVNPAMADLDQQLGTQTVAAPSRIPHLPMRR